MGLDMYLEGRTFNWPDYRHPEKDKMHNGYRLKGVMLELGYWRKHPNLHGFIVQTFADGKDNCQEIELGADDMRRIVLAIKAGALPHTEGFFFGYSSDHDPAESIEIFEKAIAWLENSDRVPQGQTAFETSFEGGRMTGKAFSPEDFKDLKESRTVIYQASW